MRIFCWLIGHKWKILLGNKNVGWGIVCDRCQKSILGDY